ncbi:hypothetical protein HPB52_022028 [Rhipicephalus sanguineus]|uniref:N-chimaerin n=1 Tax=Rhipicephalus sanguineus TaxID=34632 RepID=A0A9D4PTZ4_RHISA|nr:hypothetical protein HPB52_022028 [Rhipicephalus sanguineus]
MLQEGDGCYLVRESQRAPGQYTLSLRFGNACKNFRLYHDGMHYVGEKRFATLQDLVADGLITMYLETYAGEYINSMCAQSRYEDSPYMTLHSYQRQLRQKQQQSLRMRHHRQPPPAAEQESHEYDKPDEELDCPLLDGIPEDINVQDFEKPHAFKVNNFKGLPWCDFCGNFMWGLIAQGVRCEEKVPNDCLPDTKYVKRVFGVDLTTLVKAHNTPRPFVLDMCIKEIEQRESNKVEEKLEAMKEAVKSLPPAHYQSLKYLMSHLQRVSEHQKKNLMSPKNLSTVFSPTVMRTPDIMGMGLDQMSAWHTESAVVELLISYNRTVFVQ